MICSNCGNEIPNGSKFCFRCGKKFNTTVDGAHNTVPSPPIYYQDIKMSAAEIAPSTNPTETGNFCEKCGKPIPQGDTVCRDCASIKKNSKNTSGAKKTVIALVIVVAILFSCNIGELILLNNAKNELSSAESDLIDAENRENSARQSLGDVQQELSEAKENLESANGELSDIEEKYEDIKKDSALYDKLQDAVIGKNIGYASDKYYANTGILYISKSGGTKKLQLTAKYSSVTVHKETYGESATATYDKVWTGYSTTLTVTPEKKGLTYVDFTNNVDTSTFRVIIIVY